MNSEALGNISDISTGIAPRLRAAATKDSNQRVCIVGIRSLTVDSMINLSALESMELGEELPGSTRALRAGDVLLSIRGNLPKCGLVEFGFPEATYASGNLAVIRPDTTKILSTYLWAYLAGISRDEEHPLLTRAVTQQLSIRIPNLAALQIPLPALARQEVIGRTALALRDAVMTARDAVAAGELTFTAFMLEVFSTP